MKSYRIWLLVLCLSFFLACHHKNSSIEPPGGPPTAGKPAPPSEPVPAPPEPTPVPSPPPAPTPPKVSKSLDAPPVKPRQPSAADPAALKMVQQGVKDLNAGNLDDAEQVFEQALRTSPSFGKPYYYLGVVSYKQKDYKRSLAFLEQAETYLAGDDFWLSQVYLQEALSLEALNLKDTAKKKLRLALEKDPKNDSAKKELDKLGP